MTMKEVRDPIYGFITLSPDEWKLVDTRPFQRLRRIKQLGTSYLDYPSAEHNRFSHSLGVLHLATRIYDLIVQKNKTILGWSKDEVAKYRQLLRLAALLHDTGHAPFSHAAEGLFPEGMEHEDYTVRMILESEMTSIIDKIGKTHGFSPREVAALIQGKVLPNQMLLREIAASELDADKMDYLLRDSYHAGVEYGRYDLQRVLQTLDIFSYHDGVWELAVEADGVHAIEGLVLARYFMFVQVYLHKTRRMYDHVLSEFLKTVLPDGHYPDDLEEFLGWNDHKVLELAKANADQNVWADRLLNRKHLKLIEDWSPHVSEEVQEILREIKRVLETAYPREQLFIDEYKKKPIKFRGEDNEPTIRLIVNRDPIAVDEKSAVIKRFDVPIHLFRIYADPEIADEVKDLFAKKYSQMLGGRN